MSESILEKALLEAEQLEETMKSNAKEILSSTMKKEIHELVKESLNEDDYLKEQEEEEVDVLDIEDEMEGEEPEMDVEVSDDIELDIEDETEDEPELPELPPLDLTLASDEEVLKVFKAMGDDDGIIIQQDDDEIELTDNTTDTEYIIKLEESKKQKTMKKAVNENKTEVSEMEDMDNMDEMEDEVVYEIELSEDDDMDETEVEERQKYGGNKGDESRSKRDYTESQKYGGNKGDESRSRRDYSEEQKYGGNKGDESRSRRDYAEAYGGNKGDESRSRRDYSEEQKYGGNKGDESRSRRDYSEGKYGGNKGDESRSRRDYSEGKYGGNKGDESRSRRDYTEGKYGGNKGDESRSKRDYAEGHDWGGNKDDYHREMGAGGHRHKTGDVGGGKYGKGGHYKDYELGEDSDWGGNKGDYHRHMDSAGHKTKSGVVGGGKYGKGGHYKDYEMDEASRTLGFGRESGGKHKPSGIRKAITNNRNLGESRLRKSYNLLKEEVDTLKVKNTDYKKALTTFRDKLNEVGVFNSNLAYVTRLFTEHSTTKQEKINILKRFDNIDSLKSSKKLYKVIKEELTQEVAKPTKTIAESVENKITKSPTSGGGKLLESKVYENPQFSRMKDLMSKLK